MALSIADDPEMQGLALKLLTRNRQSTDYPLMERFLTEASGDDHMHWIVGIALDYIKVEPAPEASPSLLLIYQKSPCIICRKYAVEQLLALNLLPEWLRLECLYDANREISQLVRNSA